MCRATKEPCFKMLNMTLDPSRQFDEIGRVVVIPLLMMRRHTSLLQCEHAQRANGPSLGINCSVGLALWSKIGRGWRRKKCPSLCMFR